ncbi:MAG: PAS-domain containing protein [Paracoccaceae bacterium]|nr:PAS-domain containing protein [Paracoccaceae bacterium]MDG2257177.1 PAS-domain containing protein [Paracoccaceae bacterium]
MRQTKSQADALLLAGMNLIQQAISVFDQDMKLVVFNQPMTRMFDLPAEITALGTSFEDVIRYLSVAGEYGEIDDIDEFVRVRVELAESFEAHYMERRRSNGQWISVEGTPLPQGGWVTVYTDITRAKQQDTMLRARSEELSEQVLARSEELAATNRELEATIGALEETKRQLTEIEARTRLTTEMMPAHIAHVGPDTIYTYSNRRLSSVLPGRPGNVVGMTFEQAVGDQAYESIQPNFEKALKGTGGVFEFNDNDSARRIRVAFTPDWDEDRKIRGVYILSMDITEETQARVALQQGRRREMAAQLTSGLAHDFSNLLTVILGMQSRLHGMTLPQDADTLVTGTLAAARRGGNLLNRIADITGSRSPKPVATDLDRFLSDLAIIGRPSLPDGVNLTINALAGDGPFLLDNGLLQDSLLNLILNARDSCGKTGDITLTVTAVRETWVEFLVDDTGLGFSERALKHALDPFFTTKGSEGSGLGLAMVYDMTKTVGGDIKISNTSTGGRVSLRVPLRRSRATNETGLVLLVEDNTDLRDEIRKMLTEGGYSVIESGTVKEARVLAKELPDIALILSDIQLEGDETGIDLVSDLQHLPCYLMTSLPLNDPLHNAAHKAAPVLPKPFTQTELMGFLS